MPSSSLLAEFFQQLSVMIAEEEKLVVTNATFTVKKPFHKEGRPFV